jgi:hypothetical protein
MGEGEAMGYAKDRRLWAGIRLGRRLLPQSASVARRIVQGGGVETVRRGGGHRSRRHQQQIP